MKYLVLIFFIFLTLSASAADTDLTNPILCPNCCTIENYRNAAINDGFSGFQEVQGVIIPGYVFRRDNYTPTSWWPEFSYVQPEYVSLRQHLEHNAKWLQPHLTTVDICRNQVAASNGQCYSAQVRYKFRRIGFTFEGFAIGIPYAVKEVTFTLRSADGNPVTYVYTTNNKGRITGVGFSVPPLPAGCPLPPAAPPPPVDHGWHDEWQFDHSITLCSGVPIRDH